MGESRRLATPNITPPVSTVTSSERFPDSTTGAYEEITTCVGVETAWDLMRQFAIVIQGFHK